MHPSKKCRTHSGAAPWKPSILGIPALAVLAIVVAAIGAAVLRWTHWGRDFYAIGSNPEAARYSGIPVGLRVLLAFTISGALAGLGGFMYGAGFANVSAASGSGSSSTSSPRS